MPCTRKKGLKVRLKSNLLVRNQNISFQALELSILMRTILPRTCSVLLKWMIDIFEHISYNMSIIYHQKLENRITNP